MQIVLSGIHMPRLHFSNAWCFREIPDIEGHLGKLRQSTEENMHHCTRCFSDDLTEDEEEERKHLSHVRIAFRYSHFSDEVCKERRRKRAGQVLELGRNVALT